MLSNPLVPSVFDALLTQTNWKIHTLSAWLSDKGYLTELDAEPGQNVFKQNFMIMNALYSLAEELTELGYGIVISSLDIHLYLYSDTKSLNAEPVSPALKAYYLDWANYHTESHEIDALLNSFWQAYLSNSYHAAPSAVDIQNALKRFDLESEASLKQINKRWRQLALKYHPDKRGGNKEKFQQLHQDWQVLKASHG